jgi:hypothetical protein
MARPNVTSALENARSTFRMMRDPTLSVWALYIFLSPVYLWASGLPQIGDVLVIVLAPLALVGWNARMTGDAISTLRALLLFTVYVVAVNLVWSLALGAWSISLKRGFGLSPLFYIYNALVFVVVIAMSRRHGARFLWFTGKIILGALVVQTIVALAAGGGSRRATLLFNNPNQLGYYALLSVSMLFLLQRRRYVSSLEVAIGGVAASYLALLSASKAALASIALLVVVSVFVRLRTILVVGGLFSLTLLVANPMRDAIDQAISRFDTDESHGFIEERGYDRIAKYPEHWIFGSGEGAYARFAEDTVIGSHEIHSSIGTLFFCYGTIGTLLFGAFLWMVLRGGGFRTALLVMPSLAYGMTHQGLRFTLFWVLLALVVQLRDDAAGR